MSKKQFLRRPIFVVLIVVYVVLAVVIVHHFWFSAAPVATQHAVTSGTANSATPQDPQPILARIKAAVNGKSPTLQLTDLNEQSASQNSSGLQLQVPHYKYKVSSAVAPGLLIDWRNGDPSRYVMRQTVFDTLQANGFSAQGSMVIPDGRTAFAFEHNGLTCQIVDKERNVAYSDPYSVQVNCYDQFILAQLAQDVQPYYDAYQKARPGNNRLPNGIFLSAQTVTVASNASGIKPSQVAGYDVVMALLVPNGKLYAQIVLLYRHNNTLQFVGFATDTGGFSCRTLQATDELKAIFATSFCIEN